MSSNRHEFSQDSFRHSQAKLLYISASKYGGDWYSVPHTHSCSEIFYVVEGEGQFFIETQTYPVSANDLILVSPNVLHTESSIHGSSFQYIVLGIEGWDLVVSGEEENTNFRIIDTRSIRDTLRHSLQTMLLETEHKKPGYEQICQSLMEILIVLLGRQSGFEAALTTAPPRKISRLCGATKRYIDSHYQEEITLDRLAQIHHVSKYHLAHAFTAEYGISPINYLISKRIQEAEHLLSTTDFSLSLISHTTGFSSPSYFAQIFKKQKGCTPREYRKGSRQSERAAKAQNSST